MARSVVDARPARVAVFLDRDGVINRLVRGDYVRRWADFTFEPGAIDALSRLHRAGAALFVVTNQRGIARGLVDPTDLADVHRRMAAALAAGGAPLDGVYVCPHDVGACDCRKPAGGLFEQARQAHAWIDYRRSEMIGDSFTDLQAGHRLGMRNWLVGPHRRWIRFAAATRGIGVAGSAPTLADLVAAGTLLAALGS
jgi:D-glycero-D-manno-heptose 1,7-bisphosphate phosphatase